MLFLFLGIQSPTTGFSLTRPTVVMAANPMAGYMNAFAWKSGTVMAAGYDGDTKFWRVTANRKVTFEDALQIWPAPNSAEISPDGKTIFLVGEKAIEAWDRKLIQRKWSVPAETSTLAPYCHANLPYVMVWSGPTVLRIGINDGKVQRLPITMPFDPIPGTSRVVSAEGITDLATAKLIRPWRKGFRLLEPVAVSPDGKYAVVGNENPGWSQPTEAATEAGYARMQELKVFRIADGRLLATVPGFAAGSGWYGLISFPKPGQFSAPRLGWIRSLRTGRIIKRIPYAPPDGYDTQSIRLFSNKGHSSILLPPYPVSVQDFLVNPSGGMTIVRSQKALYRSPMSSGGYRPVLTEVGLDGKSYNRFVKFLVGKLSLLPSGIGVRTVSTFLLPNGIKSVDFQQTLDQIVRGNTPKKIAIDYQNSQLPKPSTDTEGAMGSPAYAGTSTVPLDYFSCFTQGSDRIDKITVWNKRSPGVRFIWKLNNKLQRLNGYPLAGSPERLAFSVESQKNRSGEIVILSSKDGSELGRLSLASAARGLEWSPDGSTLLAFGWGWTRAYRMETTDSPVDLLVSGKSTGDNLDFSISWLTNDRIAYGNSLSPIQVIDLKTGLIESSAVFFADGNWRAWNAHGESDGTARADCGPIKVWDGQRWQAAKSRSFWLKSLTTPASPRQTLPHRLPVEPAGSGSGTRS